MARAPGDLVSRLLEVEVSALCDADKTLPVLDPAIRAMVPDVRMAGPALTVVAEDDHLPVLSALAQARAGDVLVIAPPAQILAALDSAEAIGRAERAMLARMAGGTPLADLTTWAEHVARLDRGEESGLEFRVGADGA